MCGQTGNRILALIVQMISAVHFKKGYVLRADVKIVKILVLILKGLAKYMRVNYIPVFYVMPLI